MYVKYFQKKYKSEKKKVDQGLKNVNLGGWRFCVGVCRVVDSGPTWIPNTECVGRTVNECSAGTVL